MKKIFGLVASLNVLCAQADAQTYSRYKMPRLPEDAFAGPVQVLNHGLEEERVGQGTYSWTVRENDCRTVTLTIPVECREVDDGAYGALYCDPVANQAGVYATISDECAPRTLSLNDAQGFSVLPVACSYTALYDLLGTYLPEGQIEGIQYVSLNKSKLMERVDAYLKTDADRNAFSSWILAQKSSDLRMRAKEVRYNQWGGQGADEWIVFCSKNESVSYLLQRNLWSE
jgi:hypothetical protein